MGLLDDLFPKPKNIASDILRRDVRPGGVGERSPVSSHHGDAVLQGSSHAEDVFLDTQPTLAQESLGRSSRDRTVHVDNPVTLLAANTLAHKSTIVESVANLPANAIFLGAWHDSQLTGDIYALITTRTDQLGNISVQLSDDITNPNFVFNADAGAVATGVNQLHHFPVFLRSRFWRVLFTNGATPTTSLEITSCSQNVWMGTYNTGQGAESAVGSLVVQPTSGGQVQTDNNKTAYLSLPIPSNGAPAPLGVVPFAYGGDFSGTADLTRQGSSKQRTPTVFRRVSTIAAGSTVVWTPGTSNKFRLLRFRVTVSALAKAAVAADLVIDFLDNVTSMNLASVCTIPIAAAGNGLIMDSGWCDLGTFGILSAGAGQALNVNLSFALTGGLVNIQVCGTEE